MLQSVSSRLLVHYGLVARHLGDRRALRQKSKFVDRPRLELAAVLNERRTDGYSPGLRTDQRAGAQRACHDCEYDERHLDEDPAQHVDVRHKGKNGGPRLRKNIPRHLDVGRASRSQASRIAPLYGVPVRQDPSNGTVHLCEEGSRAQRLSVVNLAVSNFPNLRPILVLRCPRK